MIVFVRDSTTAVREWECCSLQTESQAWKGDGTVPRISKSAGQQLQSDEILRGSKIENKKKRKTDHIGSLKIMYDIYLFTFSTPQHCLRLVNTS